MIAPKLNLIKASEKPLTREFCVSFKRSLYREHLWTTASGDAIQILLL